MTAPAWLTHAATGVVEAAACADLAGSPEEGRRWVVDAINRFAETVRVNGGSDFEWLVLAATCADVIIMAAPEWYTSSHLHGVGMVDQATGARIDNPDSNVAGDDHGVAALAAMRMVAAHANGDKATFTALFRAAGVNRSGGIAMLLLAEMAGSAWVGQLARDGGLSPGAKARWLAREAGRRLP